MGAPERLADWTITSIRRLLEAGYEESDRFDFKEFIVSKDPNHRTRIRDTACAFANTDGGFLVFGVRDKGSPAERLVGLPKGEEHATQLANTLSSVEPSLIATPQNPALRLRSGRAVLVAEFSKSRRGPHWDPSSREFYRRVHGRNLAMTREEIRMAFVDQEERLRRIYMVYLSLVDNWVRLEVCVAPEGGAGPIPLISPDPSVIRAHLIEFPTLCPDLVEPLLWIVRELDVACARLVQLQSLLHEDPGMKIQVAAHHRYEIHDAMRSRLRPRMNYVLEALQRTFGFAAIDVTLPRKMSLPPIPEHWQTGRIH